MVDSALLFNNMPYIVRNNQGNTLNGFKMTLNQTLENIPDCPPSQGLHPEPINCETGKNSNCLIDWCKFLKVTFRGRNDS